MKTGIHPSYQPVIFHDTAANHSFLTRACIDTKGRDKMKWADGKDYPVIKVEISSESSITIKLLNFNCFIIYYVVCI